MYSYRAIVAHLAETEKKQIKNIELKNLQKTYIASLTSYFFSLKIY